MFEKREEWTKLPLMLRCSTELSRKIVDRSSQTMGAVARVSQAFQDSNVEFAVLSVYEQKTTRISSTFMPSKKEILVDQSLARTSAKFETMIGADKDHPSICHFTPNDPTLVDLKAYLEQVERTVVRSTLEMLHQDAASVAWTRTQSEFPDLAFMPSRTESEFPSTQGATAGMSLDMSSFDFLPLNEPIGGIVQTVKLPHYMFKSYTRNPDFFGRKDALRILEKALAPSRPPSESENRAALKCFALCGVGGLGKTSIAVEFAHANKDLYKAIFVLPASDTEKLAQLFAEISVALGLENEAGDQIVSKNIVLGWLSQPVRRIREGTAVFRNEKKDLVPWLLVFDNADDLNVLRDFWPQSECGSILVTSRDPLAKTRTHVPVTEGLDLEPFSPQDAGLLLRQLTRYSSSADIAPSEIVGAKLSGLPLAIIQTAGTINFEDLGPGAKSLLDVIAFLDPDQISKTVLMKMEAVEPKYRPKAYPESMLDFVDARSEVTIHRIVQDSIKIRLGADKFKARFTSVALLMYAAWPFSEFEHSTARWRLCEPIISHVANLHRIYLESDVLQDLETARSELARLFMDFGCDYEGAIDHAAKSVGIFKIHDKYSWRLLQAYNELNEAYIAAWRYKEALDQAELAIAGYFTLPDDDYPDWSVINKAFALCNLGRLEEASVVLEDYLSLREKTFSPIDSESFKTGQCLYFLRKVRLKQ
ncbi:P-loop containing nucleoside triphosphate hydrolase protein [Lophiotrema nucula]|uniref:P-loop containing nucleoside triphosphate hydrolase protein n=1 Tax=Lophiotrema nucula TaxID=690887 RepID=A0A6A5YG66_9PLEO|nr:P-loop containing nucleoside triphosphate hydrolase protein [Lophiotrema nucula]